MIRSQFMRDHGEFHSDLGLKDFGEILQKQQGILWVDFQGEENQSAEPVLLDVFKFHPLAVDDALQETHVPKVDDWEEYLYVALQAVRLNAETRALDSVELDVFVGKNYIVTHHDLAIEALDRVWETFGRDERYAAMGADHLLYRLADELVVDYMHTIEDLDNEIETIEDSLYIHPTPALLERTFDMKRAALRLRRVLSPTREVLNRLARDEFAVIDHQDQVYFRDIYDHLVRLHDITESIRDLIGGTQDTYLSVINNRMNDIMKTLTVITTLFMPVSFIVGFFGMNFFTPAVDFSAWTSHPSFYISLAVLILTPASMMMWMRRRGWM